MAAEQTKPTMADLETRLDATRSVLKDRIETLEDDLEEWSDDARADRAELRATVEDLSDQVAKLQFGLEQLKGLGDTESTTPTARVRDLRATMIQRADELSHQDGVKLWWEEVQAVFADCGHGEIKKRQCYDAMDDAADADGFAVATKVNQNGNEVKAIRLKSAALPTSSGSVGNNTSGGVTPHLNGGDLPVKSNSD